MTKKRGNHKATNTTKRTRAFLDRLDEIPDPLKRYRRATDELEKHQQAVVQISSARSIAVADAYDAGSSVRALAERLGLSPPRVHQLIHEARDKTRSPT
jgi:DNA-directed RNA polymerase specialized sigma24 family protein